MIAVLEPGPLATVQDLGRLGYGAWGISVCGAADRGSHRLANRLVGNDESAATIEVTMGGLRVRFDDAALVALTGAAAAVVVDGVEAAMHHAFRVPAGATLSVGVPASGVRTYLAVRGGFAGDPVLGSRSADLSAGIGPARLTAGTVLTVGELAGALPPVDWAPVAPPIAAPVLTGTFGPRDDLFTASTVDGLSTFDYVVGAHSDRVGVRLAGPALERRDHTERLSEGVVPGAIEVPSDGQPIVFLCDHPSTCGYPVIGVLDDASLDTAAQVRPGQHVRLRLRPPAGGPLGGPRPAKGSP